MNLNAQDRKLCVIIVAKCCCQSKNDKRCCKANPRKDSQELTDQAEYPFLHRNQNGAQQNSVKYVVNRILLQKHIRMKFEDRKCRLCADADCEQHRRDIDHFAHTETGEEAHRPRKSVQKENRQKCGVCQ